MLTRDLCEDACKTVIVPGTQGARGPKGNPGDLLYFTSERTTCDDYALSVLKPTPLQNDIGVVVQTRGVGAIMRNIPDSTEIGGDCRGDYATDWQTYREDASQVASGELSVVCGGASNTAKGSGAIVVGGEGNIAENIGGVCVGGYKNHVDGIDSFCGGGYINKVTGVNTVCVGGRYNTVTGEASFCGGGENNEATATGAVSVGGGENKVTGILSFCGGGGRNIVSPLYSSCVGGYRNEVGRTISEDGEEKIIGDYSFCGGGYGNKAWAHGSTVGGGESNTTEGIYSCIPGGIGLWTPHESSCAVGKYNKPGRIDDDVANSERVFMIGRGVDIVARENLLSVTHEGNLYVKGEIASETGADFAEFFESSTGVSIPVGTPVVFVPDTKKIRPARLGEVPFGVVSDTAGFIGNSASEEWHGKYERGPDGKVVYEQVEEEYEVPVVVEKEIEIEKKIYDREARRVIMTKEKQKVQEEVSESFDLFDEKGVKIGTENVVSMEKKKRTVRRPKLSSLYNPDVKYVSRAARAEWNIVGLLGVVKLLPGSPVAPGWRKLDGDNYLIK